MTTAFTPFAVYTPNANIAALPQAIIPLAERVQEILNLDFARGFIPIEEPPNIEETGLEREGFFQTGIETRPWVPVFVGLRWHFGGNVARAARLDQTAKHFERKAKTSVRDEEREIIDLSGDRPRRYAHLAAQAHYLAARYFMLETKFGHANDHTARVASFFEKMGDKAAEAVARGEFARYAAATGLSEAAVTHHSHAASDWLSYNQLPKAMPEDVGEVIELARLQLHDAFHAGDQHIVQSMLASVQDTFFKYSKADGMDGLNAARALLYSGIALVHTSWFELGAMDDILDMSDINAALRRFEGAIDRAWSTANGAPEREKEAETIIEPARKAMNLATSLVKG